MYWSKKNIKKKVWHIGTYTKSFSFLVQLVSEILISKVIQLKWGGPQLYNLQYPASWPRYGLVGPPCEVPPAQANAHWANVEHFYTVSECKNAPS